MLLETTLTAIRRFWVRANLRCVHYSDRHRSLNEVYRVSDPWDMESEREWTRFERTNALITENIGHVGTLLEVGCGEGHQSQHLIQVCDQLYGIDVSNRAVNRAEKRCPQGKFEVGSLFNARCISEVRHFDLAVACEVLYYMKDIPATLRRLSQCSERCLVTYYGPQADRIDPYVLANRDARSTTICYGEINWTVAWWRNG